MDRYPWLAKIYIFQTGEIFWFSVYPLNICHFLLKNDTKIESIVIVIVIVW